MAPKFKIIIYWFVFAASIFIDFLIFRKLTHYSPVSLFYTGENVKKPLDFLMFLGVIEKQNRAAMA